jgi:acetyl-CoA synthetase
MVVHTHQSYPVGHLSTMFFAGIQPGDRHWNISSPGWAKHAWSSFCTVECRSDDLCLQLQRDSTKAVLEALVRHRVTTLCAPPTVWRMLVQEPLADYRVSLREALSAGEPLNPEVIERVRSAWNLTIRDGAWPDGNDSAGWELSRASIKPGLMGRPLIGYPIVLLDSMGNHGSEGEICIDLSNRPIGLTPGYFDEDERTSDAMRDGYYHTGDVATETARVT